MLFILMQKKQIIVSYYSGGFPANSHRFPKNQFMVCEAGDNTLGKQFQHYS